MVAILFSGGKDSTHVINYCLRNDIDIEALIAVKPINDEAYLWHYATVEWTTLIAKSVGLPLVLIECNEIGPEVEALVLEKVFPTLRSDTIMLGGVGLQETQIRKVADVAAKYGKKVVIPYKNYTSEQLLKEELDSGMEIMITEVAADGLTKDFLGKKITKENFSSFRDLAKKHGFDVLGEGGSYNTYVTDAPFYHKKIIFADSQTVWDDKTRSGHLLVKAAVAMPKLAKQSANI